MSDENKSPPWGVLAATGGTVAAVAGAIAIAKEDGPTIVRAVVILAILAAGFALFLGRARIRVRLATLSGKGKRGMGLAILAAGAATIALVYASPPKPAEPLSQKLDSAGAPAPGQEGPDLANMSMEGGPMDPNVGSFGIPSHGNGSSLFRYHQEANPKSLLNEAIDEPAAKAWYARNEAIPILRNYCRIDPYAGVLAMQIIPSRDRILVRTQGSRNSVLGRAQTYEPALAKIDAEGVRTRSAQSAACTGKSCGMDLSDGSKLSIRWKEAAREVRVTDGSNAEADGSTAAANIPDPSSCARALRNMASWSETLFSRVLTLKP